MWAVWCGQPSRLSTSWMIFSMARYVELLSHVGVRLRAPGGKRWWPSPSNPWICFTVNTKEGVVEIGTRKRQMYVFLRNAVMGLQAGMSVRARTVMATASILNSFQWT